MYTRYKQTPPPPQYTDVHYKSLLFIGTTHVLEIRHAANKASSYLQYSDFQKCLQHSEVRPR
jgi:hypothetical protein